MKKRIDIIEPSPAAWIKAVLSDFDTFLQDHADCERKASAMALSLVAKYPDRVLITKDLIDTAIEELEHFRDVYFIMSERGIQLQHQIKEDEYVKQLINLCRNGREERFMDRLILGSVVECRGAERFRLIYENVEDPKLKSFYHRLWASEAKHGEVFIDLALKYFEQKEVYNRVTELMEKESEIMLDLPIHPRLH
jgi:tRNA-(ms[2]io[6]A)-hydroxylase